MTQLSNYTNLQYQGDLPYWTESGPQVFKAKNKITKLHDLSAKHLAGELQPASHTFHDRAGNTLIVILYPKPQYFLFHHTESAAGLNQEQWLKEIENLHIRAREMTRFQPNVCQVQEKATIYLNGKKRSL